MPQIEFDFPLTSDDADRQGDNFGWANVRMSREDFANQLSAQIHTLEVGLAGRDECDELLATFEQAAWGAWESWDAWEMAAIPSPNLGEK